MGYRLEISKVKYITGFGKLYGYTSIKPEELKSYIFLKERHYLDDYSYDNELLPFYEVNGNPHIIMFGSDLKEFIELYNEDMRNAIKNDKSFYYNKDNENWVIEKANKEIEFDGLYLLEWC